MLHLRKLSVFMLMVIALPFLTMGCNGANPPATNTPLSPTTNQAAGNKIASSPAATGIKEHGLLKSVEDSGYPFFTLVIEFPERKFSETFGINLEAVKGVDVNTLNGAVGKYVSFEYDSEISNALLDLRMNGKSLFPESDASGINANTKTIEGILSNAAEETTGDVPGELYIKTEEEITEKFPFFITADIVQANGKVVVGFYDQRTSNTITGFKVSQ